MTGDVEHLQVRPFGKLGAGRRVRAPACESLAAIGLFRRSRDDKVTKSNKTSDIPNASYGAGYKVEAVRSKKLDDTGSKSEGPPDEETEAHGLAETCHSGFPIWSHLFGELLEWPG